MNKYPKAVYKIGNEFRILKWEKRFIFTKKISERISELIDDEGEAITSRNTSLIVRGITAETLAELSRANGESIKWDSFDNFVSIYQPHGDGFIEKFMQQNEPLGEFLLRVAIARNYLTKSD